MEFSNTLLSELEELVRKLDENCILDRHLAIKEAARLLLYLAHEEYHANISVFDQSYSIIAGSCRAFIERKQQFK